MRTYVVMESINVIIDDAERVEAVTDEYEVIITPIFVTALMSLMVFQNPKMTMKTLTLVLVMMKVM